MKVLGPLYWLLGFRVLDAVKRQHMTIRYPRWCPPDLIEAAGASLSYDTGKSIRMTHVDKRTVRFEVVQ